MRKSVELSLGDMHPGRTRILTSGLIRRIVSTLLDLQREGEIEKILKAYR